MGKVVGPVIVEHEENGSSTAELTVQGSANAGDSISIGSSAGTLFTGLVDRAENTDQGLVRLECTSGLQRAVNRLTRNQIDSMFSGAPWHPDLSDDEAQGWDYFQDRMKTYFGSVNASSGVPQLVGWGSGGGGGSPVIETSTNTPSYTTLLDGVIFEIEYRVPTYEQVTAQYSWTDSDQLPVAEGEQMTDFIRAQNQAKFDSARMTRGEVEQLLRSTGWVPAFVDGDSISQWRMQDHIVEAIYYGDQDDENRNDFVVINTNPTTSFNATLVKRFESQLIIKGTMTVGNASGSIKRVRIAREYPGTAPDGWKTQLGEPPEIDFVGDLNSWINAHAAAAHKEIQESHRQNSVTVTSPLASAFVNGSVIKVVHRLDPDAGIAVTETTYSTYGAEDFDSVSVTLDEKRDRAPGPAHLLTTRVIDQESAGTIENQPGLIKTVGTLSTYSWNSAQQAWRLLATRVTSVSKSSFTMPAPEYSDTDPIEIGMSVS
ncbi:hypothetical protein [Marinospirillum celere]|uniref:hypothetical protein n=1 Tax=Marinospirillum celere TaxID=1122252 RepID=UPI000B88761F|nr:hypothetical protein [Marinospirillum celere]